MQTVKPNETILWKKVIRARKDMELWVRIIKSGILDLKVSVVRFRPRKQEFQSLGRFTFDEADLLLPVLWQAICWSKAYGQAKR